MLLYKSRHIYLQNMRIDLFLLFLFLNGVRNIATQIESETVT